MLAKDRTMRRADGPVTPLGLALEASKSVPVNLQDLARRLGVRVRFEALSDDISGNITRDGEDFVITINARHPKTRQRFTLAHELGHFILHRRRLAHGTNDTRAYRADPAADVYNDQIKRRHETEANQFAASLLMPEDLVIKAYQTFRGNDPGALADFFGVSRAAMEIRLEELSNRGKL